MELAASLILPTRNRADILRQSLPRMLDQTAQAGSFEIVVVDDASDDDTADAVVSIGSPDIVYRRQPEQQAAASARNRAIEIARGKLLIFVDDDAFVRRDYVAEHLAAHEGQANVAVSGPIVEVSAIPEERDPPAGPMIGRHINAFPTGNASVSREAIVAAGLFDTDFRSYGWEDAEMFRRLLMAGVNRRYHWKVPIYHYKAPTTRRNFLAQLETEERRGHMGAIYYAKHPNLAVALQTKQIGVLNLIERGLSGLFGIEKRIAEMRATGVEPTSDFIRFLMINHSEMATGRRIWKQMSRTERRALAEATRAKVTPLT